MSLDQGQETGISRWAFILGAAVVVVGAFAAVWFALPGPDTRHRLVSPSGQAALELAELCTDNGCNRVAIFEFAGTRTGCPLDIPGNRPVFVDVTAHWASDEIVDIAHIAADGTAGAITFARAECTLTQQR
jgi:hypothetical protein